MKTEAQEFPVFDLQAHHSKVKVPTEFDLRDLARKYQVFPLKVVMIEGRRRLLLAMKNPFHLEALADVEFRAGIPAVPVQADQKDIHWLIQTHYFGRKLSPVPSQTDEGISHDMFQQLELATNATETSDWTLDELNRILNEKS